jgi:citrate lyase beta subunit
VATTTGRLEGAAGGGLMSTGGRWSDEALKAERVDLRESRARAPLPERWYAQTAHLTTPASDLVRATKAVEEGFGPALRLFEKWRIAPADLAETFGVAVTEVEAVLSGPTGAPLVLLDGEDAQALTDDVVRRGRANAVRLFREGRWGGALRFWRPSGFALDWVTDDLLEVLVGAGEGRAPDEYPVDGVMWPKAEHPDELAWLGRVLSEVEARLGLPDGRLKVEFLVESAAAVLRLPALVDAAGGRLAGIVFGLADHAADLGLTDIDNTHPASDYARLAIVHAAAAAGVPAIDGMTLAYPVADAGLDFEANRSRLLVRLGQCFDDARHGARLGMSGKWVGHPAQLVACLVAFRTLLPAERVRGELARLASYDAAVAEGRGAAMIGGVMTDRANDRHSRVLVARARAMGLITG